MLLIGGNLICGTVERWNLLSGVIVSGALVGCSPFALACTQHRNWEGEGPDACRVDLTNGLEAYLRQHPAQSVVVDLHYVCRSLVRQGESLFTKWAGLKLDGVAVSAEELPKQEREDRIRSFARMLRKFFPAENIALVNTLKTEYCVVKNRVRANENLKINELFKQCEEWFRQESGCVVIDTLKFYYMVKKSGGWQYEKEAYLDLADNIKRFVRRQHIRRRPVFRYSLDRYCRYYDNIYKKAFGTFLRTGNAVENLVYSSEPWFVQEHYELLRAAEKLLKSGYREVAEGLDKTMKDADEVGQIMLAMEAAINGDYVNPKIRYDLLFKNRICVRSLWQEMRKRAPVYFPELLPQQITEVNYGYYFSLMQLELTEDPRLRQRALETVKRMQADKTVELRPYAVDLWGSCVSRLGFQYDNVAHDCKMVMGAELFQALPLFLDGPKVEYDPEIFAPPITADNLVIRHQLDGTVRDVLNRSGADWVVIDLYTLTALSIFCCQGKVYCANQGFGASRLGAEKLVLHKTFSEAEIFAELDRFAGYLHRRYGDRVILIKHKRMEHYVDFQNKICPFPEKEVDLNREHNRYNDRYAAYFANRTGCYYIDIIDQFLSDEMNLLYLNSVHYENEFYEQVRRIMGRILSEQPAQRHFTACDSLTRVRRMARLVDANPDSEVVRSLFQDGWLDEALLKLDGVFLKENEALLAALYDEGYADLAQAREKFSRSGGQVVLDRIAAGA